MFCFALIRPPLGWFCGGCAKEGRVTATKKKLAEEQHELATAKNEYTEVRSEVRARASDISHAIMQAERFRSGRSGCYGVDCIIALHANVARRLSPLFCSDKTLETVVKLTFFFISANAKVICKIYR